jgi:hypothetical protein
MACSYEGISADEIKITPEMVAWGAAELAALPLSELAEGWYPKEDAVRLIYRTMRRVELGLPV